LFFGVTESAIFASFVAASPEPLDQTRRSRDLGHGFVAFKWYAQLRARQRM
jgi:hypothetical protein